MMQDNDKIDNINEEKETELNEVEPSLEESNKLLQNQLDVLLKKYEEEKINNYKENLANLANQKKRFDNELEDMKKYAMQKAFKDFLLVLDALVMAINSFDPIKEATDIQTIKEINNNISDALKMTNKLFINTLKDYDVEEVEVNGDFDAKFHECVGVDANVQKNKIANVLMTGYKIKDRILRAAKVIVGSKEE